MNVLTVGAGFVGATHSAILASNGHNVLAYDLDEKKIADLASRDASRIDSRIYEPGLAKLIQQNRNNLEFITNLQYVDPNSIDIVFLCLPTPAEELERPLEKRCLYVAAKQVAEHFTAPDPIARQRRILFVNKSTVPIGTAKMLDYKLSEWGLKNYGVGSNPEFLVEGKAVEGSQKPDRVVIGTNTPQDDALLSSLYSNIPASKIEHCSPSDAEAVKLLANFELFARVVMSSHVAGRLCESNPDLTYEKIMSAQTKDARIPVWGHYLTLFTGGSCFDKDARNLLKTLLGCEASAFAAGFVSDVIEGNKSLLTRFYDRAKQAGFDFNGKDIALLGTAFKQDTNDVRESPAIPLTQWMFRDGVKTIRTYDPQASENYANTFKDKRIIVCKDETEALQGTQAAIISNDWPRFRTIAQLIEAQQRPYLLMDGKRMLAPHYQSFVSKGIGVIAVGSPPMFP